jgi:hypothetical protein
MTKIVPIPEHMDIEESLGRTTIKIPWNNHQLWFWLPFCLVWYAFVFWMFYSGRSSFLLLYAAVGVGGTWYTLCLLLNKSVVEIDPNGFSIKNGPLYFPTFGSVRVRKNEFTEVYIQRNAATSKYSNTTYTYTLRLIEADGRSRPMPIPLDDLEKALFIKSKIESALGIESTDVMGGFYT